jgi:5-methylcytosine-specific restriction protein A
VGSAWQGSTRRSRLPRDWPQLVAFVKDRDRGRCQADHHDPACDGIGTDVDHIERGDNHDPSNLRLLSSACHKAKTQAELADDRARANPPEAPPGLRRGGGG